MAQPFVVEQDEHLQRNTQLRGRFCNRNGQLTKLTPDNGRVTSFFTANRTGTDLVFADIAPRSGQIELQITRMWPQRSIERVVHTSTEALARGVRTEFPIEPGDVLKLSYSLPHTEDEFQPSSVDFTDGSGTKRRVIAKVPGAEFPTNATADNYAEAAARLFCPD